MLHSEEKTPRNSFVLVISFEGPIGTCHVVSSFRRAAPNDYRITVYLCYGLLPTKRPLNCFLSGCDIGAYLASEPQNYSHGSQLVLKGEMKTPRGGFLLVVQKAHSRGNCIAGLSLAMRHQLTPVRIGLY